MIDEQKSKEILTEKKMKGILWILFVTLLIASAALILAIINFLWIGNIPGA